MAGAKEWVPGTIVGMRYEIIGQLGRGAVSTVWLARDVRLDKHWAIKRYQHDGRTDNRVRDSVIEEARIWKKLDHPRIVRVVDVLDEADNTLIVMDYVEGTPLNRVIERQILVDQEVAIDIAIQLCDIVRYLHEHRPPIILWNLRPENVMLLNDNMTVKLVDLGVKQLDSMYNNHYDDCRGTELFIDSALECDSPITSGTESDIYSIGAILYHLLAHPQLPIESYSHICLDNPSVPPQLEDVIARATERDQNLRYKNVEDFLDDLSWYKCLTTQFRDSLPHEAPYSVRSTSIKYLLCLLAISLIIAIVLLALNHLK